MARSPSPYRTSSPIRSKTTPVSDAEYATASRDSQMRLDADAELRQEHLQVLASRVWLQACCMARGGHVMTDTRGIIDRATQSMKDARLI